MFIKPDEIVLLKKPIDWKNTVELSQKSPIEMLRYLTKAIGI